VSPITDRHLKHLVKAMDQNSAGFTYLKNTFPRIRDAKIKDGVFFGPQIRQLIQDIKFEDQLLKWKKQHGNHSKMLLPIFLVIIRQKTTVICWLILYNLTKLWDVICL
jgi:hypothetical protein